MLGFLPQKYRAEEDFCVNGSMQEGYLMDGKQY